MALSLKDLKLVDSMYAYTKSRYITALDCGTTSVRAVIVDEYGCIVAQASRPVKAIYPQPGWVEQDPTEILASQIAVMMEVQFKSGIHSDSIAAIGITNQRETTVVWDRDSGQPIYNAIGWQCRRTAPRAEALAQNGYADMIRAKTGLMPDAYFSATKIAWILDNVSGARELAEAGQLMFGTIDTWLIYNLTGGMVFATDYTNASRTMLFNIHTLDWDDELLELLGIPRCMLPEPRWSSGEFGRVSGEIMTHMPLITGVAGDQQASLFGHCCFEPGEAKNTYGTGCFMLMNTGDTVVESQNGLVATVGIAEGGTVSYALEGSIFHAGSVIQWLRAVVGRGRGRAHLRPHERVRPRDHRARGLRVHGVPELRRAALHGGRRGLHARQPLGGRRRLAQRLHHAVPGRHPGHSRRADGGGGDDGTRRGLPRRPCRGLLGGSRGDPAEPRRGVPLRAGDGCRGARPRTRRLARRGLPRAQPAVARPAAPRPGARRSPSRRGARRSSRHPAPRPAAAPETLETAEADARQDALRMLE